MTLHGASGTDDGDLRRAIAAGITVVHINTEVRIAWRRGLDRALSAQPNEIVPYKILPQVIDSVKGTSRGQIGIVQQRAASCAACVRAVLRKIGRRATAISQRVFSGKRVIEITRMRITEAGRKVLAESPGPVNENPHAFQPRATVANISGAAP